jgi:hypothetical protein
MKWHWNSFLSDHFGVPVLIAILPLLHTHLLPCYFHDQGAHCHFLGLKLRRFILLTQHFTVTNF